MPSISEFTQALRSGVVRQHRWQVMVNFPTFAGSNSDVRQASLLARTATTPASTLGELDLVWAGRDVPIPGDRTFTEFPVTFMAVQDFKVIDAFENWSEGINGSESNTASAAPDEYKKDVVLQLLDENDNVLKEYVLQEAWIKEIAGMELDKGSKDSFAEFTVTFRYLQHSSNTTR